MLELLMKRSQKCPRNGLKNVPETVSKMFPKWSQKCSRNGLKNVPEMLLLNTDKHKEQIWFYKVHAGSIR